MTAEITRIQLDHPHHGPLKLVALDWPEAPMNDLLETLNGVGSVSTDRFARVTGGHKLSTPTSKTPRSFRSSKPNKRGKAGGTSGSSRKEKRRDRRT